jgi:hypothetical protein
MLFSRLVSFIALQSKKYGIDSTHGLPHSLQIYGFARQLYESEVVIHPQLKEAELVITCAAMLHDMCDGKYVDKASTLAEIQCFLRAETPLKPVEVQAVSDIVSTMSYSWIQQHGFPELAEPYMRAYHVVREADLLCSYDVDRSVLFHLSKAISRGEAALDFEGAFANATDLFETRVLPLRCRGYYTTEEGYIQAARLENEALKRLLFWSKHTEPNTPPVRPEEPVYGTECSEDDEKDGCW